MNNKLYLCAIFTATILSSSANADFSDWYKKATSNEDSTQQVPAQQQQAPGQIQQQAPVQVQQQPIQQRQYNLIGTPQLRVTKTVMQMSLVILALKHE